MSTLDTVITTYRQQICTFARYFVNDASAAEDVTQEVFIRLWRNPGLLDSSKLLPWLMKVTRNVCIDSLRSRKSRNRIEVASLETTFNIVDRAPGPEDLACSSEYQKRIVDAIEELNEPCKSIVILREVQGFSYQEIADTLNMSLSNVRMSLFRGRRYLRESLKEVIHHV